MKVGIPRALLYYKNEKFWTTFFNNVGIECVLSPHTNKEIMETGAKLAIDETCLPTKLLLGHIDWLIGKCDYVFVPRVEFCCGYEMCTKFLSQTDLAQNTFRDRDVNLLFYCVRNRKPKDELKAFYKMGKFLGIKHSQVKYAYNIAKQTQMYYEWYRSQTQEKLLEETSKIKVLLVAHAYNVGDKYVGESILNSIKALNCEPIVAEYLDEKQCILASENVSKTLPWAYNRHLVGAIELLKDKVDGVILLTTFPCGPDSMVNELVTRKYKNLPIITLTVDTQDGTAGMETRLESFVDILVTRKGEK